jgi:hypothetical protein
MNRVIVELHCQRIQREPYVPSEGGSTKPSTDYNGELILRSEPGTLPHQNLVLPFRGKDLGDIAVWVHFMVRMLTAAKVEFCVRMFQKAPNSSRPPVAMDLDPAQVNKIYESHESAQIFFAPRERTRKLKPGENVEDVIREEAERAAKGS